MLICVFFPPVFLFVIKKKEKMRCLRKGGDRSAENEAVKGAK